MNQLEKAEKYIKYSPMVEAIQWTNEPGNFQKLIDWTENNIRSASPLIWKEWKVDSFTLELQTPDGAALVYLGQWIIKHGEGVFYPVSKQCFERLYNLAGSEAKGDDGWISVEDRLPEIGQQVLIYEPPYDSVHYPEHFLMAVTHYAGRKPKGERNWYQWPDGQDEQPSGYTPSHWQPLPSPPKTKQ